MCCASEAIGGDPLPQSLSLVASCSCKTAVTHSICYYSWLCLFRNSLLEAYRSLHAEQCIAQLIKTSYLDNYYHQRDLNGRAHKHFVESTQNMVKSRDINYSSEEKLGKAS